MAAVVDARRPLAFCTDLLSRLTSAPSQNRLHAVLLALLAVVRAHAVAADCSAEDAAEVPHLLVLENDQ
jgi:hypothetical protein